MQIIIDTEKRELKLKNSTTETTLDLYTKEAYAVIAEQWVKIGWNQKYSYSFNWLGRPIIQMPEDLLRLQDLIFQLKPDVIIETGIAHGGSIVFHASLCRLMGKGRVIGIDLEIKKHNKTALESHPLKEYYTLIEGDSVSNQVLNQVKQYIDPNETVLVILDSNHTYDHVSKELEKYSPLVTKDSYIIVTDGVMSKLTDVPRGDKEWAHDNPEQAALDFLAIHPDFILEKPKRSFDESKVDFDTTYFPSGWLKRIK